MSGKALTTVDDAIRIRDLAGDLSTAMDRINLWSAGIDKDDWYAVNRIFHAAANIAARHAQPTTNKEAESE